MPHNGLESFPQRGTKYHVYIQPVFFPQKVEWTSKVYSSYRSQTTIDHSVAKTVETFVNDTWLKQVAYPDRGFSEAETNVLSLREALGRTEESALGVGDSEQSEEWSVEAIEELSFRYLASYMAAVTQLRQDFASVLNTSGDGLRCYLGSALASNFVETEPILRRFEVVFVDGTRIPS